MARLYTSGKHGVRLICAFHSQASSLRFTWASPGLRACHMRNKHGLCLILHKISSTRCCHVPQTAQSYTSTSSPHSTHVTHTVPASSAHMPSQMLVSAKRHEPKSTAWPAGHVLTGCIADMASAHLDNTFAERWARLLDHGHLSEVDALHP